VVRYGPFILPDESERMGAAGKRCRYIWIEPDRFVVVVDGAIVIPPAQMNIASAIEGGDTGLRGPPAGLDEQGTALKLPLGRHPLADETSAPFIRLPGR
jgi:hypothetical protein